MDDQFSRTELMIGKENIEKINNSKVVVFGLGGVCSRRTCKGRDWEFYISR